MTTPTGTPDDDLNAATPSAQIPTAGFCVYIQRVRQEIRDGMGYARTVGDYQCYWNGDAIDELAGQIVERGGPGDNTVNGVRNHRRIEAGTYPLAIQDGERYKTYGYAESDFPFPGIQLPDYSTGARSAILIHPCHDNVDGYVSSIGCLNPAVGLVDADSRVNLTDSRSRVIAIIEGMKAKLGDAFPQSGDIPGTVLLIEGEPG